jgi:catalase
MKPRKGENEGTKKGGSTAVDTRTKGGETHQQAALSNTPLTTNQGLSISDNQNSLKAGPRGPTLLEDFIVREKITHFDHERIPERIVHARGEAAHGYFQAYGSLQKYTKAAFLNDPKLKTPVFVRFAGERPFSTSRVSSPGLQATPSGQKLFYFPKPIRSSESVRSIPDRLRQFGPRECD